MINYVQCLVIIKLSINHLISDFDSKKRRYQSNMFLTFLTLMTFKGCFMSNKHFGNVSQNTNFEQSVFRSKDCI